MKSLPIILTLALTGCTVPLEKARTAGIEQRTGAIVGHAETPERCQKLDRARTNWGIVWKGSSALAGTSALSTLPLDEEDAEAQMALALSAAALTTLTAVAAYAEEQKSQAWARECAER